MAKGPIVTDEIAAFIAHVYDQHRTWKAKEVQREVSYLLRKKNPQLPKGWPGLSAVQKVLAKLRKPQPPNPQDEPWSMASLEKYPIPPEALPTVYKAWLYCNVEADMPFTIRQAKWIVRLYHLFKEQSMDSLHAVVTSYVLAERAAELAEVDFNSTFADLLLLAVLEEEDFSVELVQKLRKNRGLSTTLYIPIGTLDDFEPKRLDFESSGRDWEIAINGRDWEIALIDIIKFIKAIKYRVVKNERTHNKEG